MDYLDFFQYQIVKQVGKNKQICTLTIEGSRNVQCRLWYSGESKKEESHKKFRTNQIYLRFNN